MSNNKLNLKETSEYLLSLDPNYDYSNEELDHLDDLATELLSQYSWSDVYTEWSDYLYNRCPTDEDVIRFAHNFFDYSNDNVVPDPLQFIAYLYYRVDVTKNRDAFDIFDSLAITVLPNAGLLGPYDLDYYAAESDPRILKEIEKWRIHEKETKR